jgi:hypothetical protein
VVRLVWSFALISVLILQTASLGNTSDLSLIQETNAQGSGFGFGAFAESVGVLKGDVNGNDRTDLGDIILTIDFFLQRRVPSEDEFVAADVDPAKIGSETCGNSEVELGDIIVLIDFFLERRTVQWHCILAVHSVIVVDELEAVSAEPLLMALSQEGLTVRTIDPSEFSSHRFANLIYILVGSNSSSEINQLAQSLLNEEEKQLFSSGLPATFLKRNVFDRGQNILIFKGMAVGEIIDLILEGLEPKSLDELLGQDIFPSIVQAQPLTSNVTSSEALHLQTIEDLDIQQNGELPDSCVTPDEDDDPDQCIFDLAFNLFDENTDTPDEWQPFFKSFGCILVGKSDLTQKKVDDFLDHMKDCLVDQFLSFLEPFIPQHPSIISIYAVTNPSSHFCSTCTLPSDMVVAALHRAPDDPGIDPPLLIVKAGDMPGNYDYDFQDYLQGPGYAIWPNPIGEQQTPTGKTFYFPDPVPGRFITFPRFIHTNPLPVLDKPAPSCVPRTPGCVFWLDLSSLYFKTYNVYNALAVEEGFFSEGQLFERQETGKLFRPYSPFLLSVDKITVGTSTHEEGGRIVTNHQAETWQLEEIRLDGIPIDPLSPFVILMDKPHTVQLRWNRLAPDLSAQALMVTPASPERGEIANVTLAIRNIGEIVPLGANLSGFAADLGDITFSVDAQKIGGIPVNYTTLLPQQSIDVSIRWDTSNATVGSHTVSAEIQDALPAEHDLLNNAVSILVDVKAPTRPDLFLDPGQGLPHEASAGETVTFLLEVMNISPVVANTMGVEVSFDVRHMCNATLSTRIADVTVPSIAGNDHTIVNFDWNTTGFAPGGYCLDFAADPLHKIPELREDNNNIQSFEFQLHSPDLVAADITHMPLTPREGDTIEVSTRINNTGIGDAFSVKLTTTIRDMSGNVVDSSNTTIAMLSSGNSTPVKADFVLATGDYEIESFVDPDDNIPEGDEQNNVLVKSLRVLPLPANPGGIRGVVKCLGDPLAGATVSVVDPMPSPSIAWQGVTNQNGEYGTGLVLDPGSYEVSASHSIFIWPIEMASVQSGLHTVVDFLECEEGIGPPPPPPI